jgi:hypothetical protein
MELPHIMETEFTRTTKVPSVAFLTPFTNRSQKERAQGSTVVTFTEDQIVHRTEG